MVILLQNSFKEFIERYFLWILFFEMVGFIPLIYFGYENILSADFKKKMLLIVMIGASLLIAIIAFKHELKKLETDKKAAYQIGTIVVSIPTFILFLITDIITITDIPLTSVFIWMGIIFFWAILKNLDDIFGKIEDMYLEELKLYIKLITDIFKITTAVMIGFLGLLWGLSSPQYGYMKPQTIAIVFFFLYIVLFSYLFILHPLKEKFHQKLMEKNKSLAISTLPIE